MGIKWRSQKKQTQDDFIRLIVGMYLYDTLSLKYGDRPHKISDGFYFNDILLTDLEKYIRLHETDDLSELMERFYPVILDNNKKLEIWIDQTLASIDKETDKVILYLENITNLKLNFQAFRIAMGTWLKILALQPELKSRTSHFSLYNVAVVYAATRKLSDARWAFRPSYCRKIELQNPSAFKQQVITLLCELYSAQGEQSLDTMLALKCLNNASVASILSDIAYQVILDARKAQRAIKSDESIVPTISVKIPPDERISSEDIKRLISRIDNILRNFVTKADLQRFIIRLEKVWIGKMLAKRRALVQMRADILKSPRNDALLKPLKEIDDQVNEIDKTLLERYSPPKGSGSINTSKWAASGKSYKLDSDGGPDDPNDFEYLQDRCSGNCL